jgi:hypothetical protein
MAGIVPFPTLFLQHFFSPVSVFRGTRVPFQALLDYLEGGQTLDEFLDDFSEQNLVGRKIAVRLTQGSQTTIQQSPIDINVVRQQLSKDTPKIGQIVAQVKGFKQTDAAENFLAFRLRQLARPVIVEQDRIRTELFRQQNCAHLVRTQTVFSLGRRKLDSELPSLQSIRPSTLPMLRAGQRQR